MLRHNIDNDLQKTIYEIDINDYIVAYKHNWKKADSETRKKSKEYWLDIYKNAIFRESFENAKTMLSVICELENEI